MNLAAMALALALGAGSPPAPAGLAEILSLLDSGRAAEAEEALRDRLARGPAAPAVRYLLGVALLYQRHFAAAEGELQAAVAGRGDRPQWFHTLALCQSEMGRLSAAVASLDRALALADDPAYHFDRAQCQANLGRFPAAMADLEAVLAAEPRHLAALLALARLLHDQGRSAEARPRLEAALPWAAGSAELHTLLGQGLLAAGESARAADFFRAALERLPSHLGATYGLAQALAALGEGAAAARERERFAELSRREEAIENRRQYLVLDPTNLAVTLELGAALLELGRAEEAWRLLDGASRMAPPSPELSRLLARAAAEAGRASSPVPP